MIRLLILALAVAFSSCLQAQRTEDVVYLLDGSIIRGQLVESGDSTLRIMTYGGNVFALDRKLVQAVTKEKPYKNKLEIKDKGYFNFTSAGILLGSSGDEKPAPLSLIMEHTFRYRNYFAGGVFMGFEQLKENTLPVGLNYKLMLPAGTVEIITGFSVGYGFPLNDPPDEAWNDNSGGIIFLSELGLAIPFTETAAFFVALGYRYNELNYDMKGWPVDYSRKIKFNRLSLRLGLSLY